MKTVEISFGELRRYYLRVLELIINLKKCKRNELVLYSGIIEDLHFDKTDIPFLMSNFVKEFDIQLNDKKESKPKYLWLREANDYLFFIYLIGVSIYFWKSALLIIIFIIVWLVVYNYINNSPKITIPNKKEWNPDKLSVADLVCMAVEKKEVYKKDIHFVLKKSS